MPPVLFLALAVGLVCLAFSARADTFEAAVVRVVDSNVSNA
jgi:hypothetical protein